MRSYLYYTFMNDSIFRLSNPDLQAYEINYFLNFEFFIFMLNLIFIMAILFMMIQVTNEWFYLQSTDNDYKWTATVAIPIKWYYHVVIEIHVDNLSYQSVICLTVGWWWFALNGDIQKISTTIWTEKTINDLLDGKKSNMSEKRCNIILQAYEFDYFLNFEFLIPFIEFDFHDGLFLLW